MGNTLTTVIPKILAMGGLTDPRVTYWEPAKWIARLRATMRGGGPVLLRTNMGAGHGGASGRFNRLDEVAIERTRYGLKTKIKGHGKIAALQQIARIIGADKDPVAEALSGIGDRLTQAFGRARAAE